MAWTRIISYVGQVGRAVRWVGRGFRGPAQYVPHNPAAPVIAGAGRLRQAVAWGGRNALPIVFGTQAAIQIADAFRSLFPSTVHEIVVTVRGNPLARIERLWQLCVATAFGKYREGPNFNYKFALATYEAVWDLTGKQVGFKIVSTMGGLAGAANRVTGGDDTVYTPQYIQAHPEEFSDPNNNIGDPTFVPPPVLGPGAPVAKPVKARVNPRQRTADPMAYLLLGPTQEIVGGRWDSVFNSAANGGKRLVIGGLPPNAFDRPLQRPLHTSTDPLNFLPDEGRMIMSGWKFDPGFQPPRPPLDSHSRGSMVSLVAAALTNEPGYLPASPPRQDTNDFDIRSSRFFYPGQTEPQDIRSRIVRWARYLTLDLFSKKIDSYQGHPDNPPDLRGPNNQIERHERNGQLR